MTIGGLFRFRDTPTGPYYITASALGTDGRAVAADGKPPFSGQAFFEPAPGTLGTLQRNLLSGPSTFTLDASLIKLNRVAERQTIEIERQTIEIRMDAFNALNHPVWTLPPY